LTRSTSGRRSGFITREADVDVDDDVDIDEVDVGVETSIFDKEINVYKKED